MKSIFTIACLLGLSLGGCDDREFSAYLQPTPTVAGDQEVRLRDEGAPCARLVTGSTVVPACIDLMLFLKAPCDLNVDGAEKMHRAWTKNYSVTRPSGRLGGEIDCWHPENGQYTWINSEGFVSYVWRSDDPRALVHADGSVTITEPNYDSEEFLHDAASERAAAAHANDQSSP